MKTIEKVREEWVDILRKVPYYPVNQDYKHFEIVDEFLSTVIEVELKRCHCAYKLQGTGEHCSTCRGSGVIMHPITIKDAIEERMKE